MGDLAAILSASWSVRVVLSAPRKKLTPEKSGNEAAPVRRFGFVSQVLRHNLRVATRGETDAELQRV
jgi:hypothetical protein